MVTKPFVRRFFFYSEEILIFSFQEILIELRSIRISWKLNINFL